MNNSSNGAIPASDEPKVEVKSGMWEVTTFLERAAIVFDRAILSTPTSTLRNQLTDLNIERLALITNAKDIALYAKRLRTVCRKLVENDKTLDIAAGDITSLLFEERGVLCKELIKILRE